MRLLAVLTTAHKLLGVFLVLGAAACGADAGRGTGSSKDAGLPESASPDAGPLCTVPLTPDSGFPSLGEVSLATWCQATQGRIRETSCDRTTVFGIGDGADCARQLVFDTQSGRLIAILAGCNGSTGCVAGERDFQPSSGCSDGVSPVAIDCSDAGSAALAPDGASVSCTSSALCPSGWVCGFFTNTPCASTGTCVYGDFNNDPTCSPTTLCACDGTLTRACTGPTGGYALKPVPTRAMTCSDSGP